MVWDSNPSANVFQLKRVDLNEHLDKDTECCTKNSKEREVVGNKLVDKSTKKTFTTSKIILITVSFLVLCIACSIINDKLDWK